MYKLKFLTSAIKELKKLDFVAQTVIKKKLEAFVKEPDAMKGQIKPLSGSFKGKFRLRIGRYRVVYQKQDDVLVILVVRIGPRKDIYKSR